MRDNLRSDGMKRGFGSSVAGLVLVVTAILFGTSVLVPAEEKEPPVTVPVQAKADSAKPKKPLGKDVKWKVTKPDLSKPVMEADNSYCLVCHINLEEEELVDIHLPVGVGCETCHGMSDDHSADEDSFTAPEIMWSKARINSRCMTCHSRADMLKDKTAAESHRKVFQRWEEPKKAKPGEKYCIQCHGEHRIRNRTREWDKESGKLLKQSGGPAMDR